MEYLCMPGFVASVCIGKISGSSGRDIAIRSNSIGCLS